MAAGKSPRCLPTRMYTFDEGSLDRACGDCINDMLDATKREDLVGDERVTWGMFRRAELPEEDGEGYCYDQCDVCNVQYGPAVWLEEDGTPIPNPPDWKK